VITRAQLRVLGDGPAIYCLYGGRGHAHPAYVGIADKLRVRIEQHLVRRDSSVTTGVATVALNPDLVTEIKWWRHDSFGDRVALQAAELIAFEILDPVLRSRGLITRSAEDMARTELFRSQMQAVFHGAPDGHLLLPSLSSVIDTLDALEVRVRRLEAAVGIANPTA
jgi:hypothetical protein